jgi:hypothetical protein
MKYGIMTSDLDHKCTCIIHCAVLDVKGKVSSGNLTEMAKY